MRRVSAMMLTALLLMAPACGRRSYEQRLDATIARMRYRLRLDQFLAPMPDDARFQGMQVFIRPPQGMNLGKQFVMTTVPEGAYDLLGSFIGESKGSPQSLHLLARLKGLKKTPAKGAPPAPVAERGPFEQDVLGLLAGVYGAGEALEAPNFQTEKKRGGNDYRRLVFNASNGNTVQAYFLKKDPYEVALIWDLPPDVLKDKTQGTARDLCLQSFAVGDRARAAFGGDMSEDENAGEFSGPAGAMPF